MNGYTHSEQIIELSMTIRMPGGEFMNMQDKYTLMIPFNVNYV